MLAYAAERRPSLLIADQAEWLDPQIGKAIAFVARRLDAKPISMRVLPAPVRMLYPVLIGRHWRRYAATLRNTT